MFGVLRTVLAFMVVVSHLWLVNGLIGAYAVFGFYVISGYLMTAVMHGTYGFDNAGQITFLRNRALRIFPMYWVALVMSIIAILAIGNHEVSGYHPRVHWPETIWQWLPNLTMIFVSWRPVDVTPMLVPFGWALTVELVFYALICFGISRSARRVSLWFSASLGYVAASFLLGLEWQDRYFPFFAASLPFSIGAGLYFVPKPTSRWVLPTTIFLLILFFGNAGAWYWMAPGQSKMAAGFGFYTNLALCSALVWCLSSDLHRSKKIIAKWDDLIGAYSYPIYLLHFQVSAIASWLIFAQPVHSYSASGFWLLVLTLPILTLVSFMFVEIIDIPVQRARTSFKLKLTASLSNNM
jgi:peptidoglycan/LPS O-acetylase OafA/YrhL